MTAPTTSAILDAAADLIERYGWAQGGAGVGPSGEVCIVNACAQAGRQRTGNWLAATDSVASYLDWKGPLQNWNDAPDRTQAEVVSVLRATALIEAAHESGVREAVRGA